MIILRNRLYYVTMTAGVIIAGLLSRSVLSRWLPAWSGDVLWGLMVFLIIGVLFKNRSILSNSLYSASFSTSVEFLKLYHAPWIEAFRYTTLGGLVLGYVFSLDNILCYLTGIVLGVAGEYLWFKK